VPEPFESDDPEPESPSVLRRRIEEQASKAKAAEERAAAAERDLAFAKAGIDLSDPKSKYLVAGYDGPIEPEAIKAAALEAGFLSPPEPVVPQAELAQHQAAAQLAAGAQGPDTVTGWENNPAYDAEMAQAHTKEQMFAVMAKHGSPRTSDIDY
jgi:hypothetical protein